MTQLQPRRGDRKDVTMMDPQHKRLAEKVLRGRSLTPAEEAQLGSALAQRPGEWHALQEEQGLNRLLHNLADAPLSSNFTAQVMEAVQRPETPLGYTPWAGLRRLLFDRWAPKVAVASLVLCLGLFSYQQYRWAARKELAQSVAAMSEITGLPAVEMLQDFEAIQRLAQVPRDGDAELIAALQPSHP
jgi:hypothetical protein